mmetsp:Transcript_13173/g.30797  ORF Transcript_13173/g.30797 Transcript_13173/m.30797 type:complete len:398 (-) Transcript_13173:89-1282(-)
MMPPMGGGYAAGMPLNTTPMGGMPGAPMPMTGMSTTMPMQTAMPMGMGMGMPGVTTTAMPAMPMQTSAMPMAAPATTFAAPTMAAPAMPMGMGMPMMGGMGGMGMPMGGQMMTVTGPDMNRDGIPDILQGGGQTAAFGRTAGVSAMPMMGAPAMMGGAARPLMTVTGPDMNRDGIPDVLQGGSFVAPSVGYAAAAPAVSVSYAPAMAVSSYVPPVTTTAYRQTSYVPPIQASNKRAIGERPVTREELYATGNLVEGPPTFLPRKPEAMKMVQAPPEKVITAPPVFAAPAVTMTAPPVMAAPAMTMAAPMAGARQMIVTGPDLDGDGIPDVLQGKGMAGATTMMAPGMGGYGMGMPMTTTMPMTTAMPMMGMGGMPQQQHPVHTHKETRPVTHTRPTR